MLLLLMLVIKAENLVKEKFTLNDTGNSDL
jgi:hypothetical protein